MENDIRKEVKSIQKKIINKENNVSIDTKKSINNGTRVDTHEKLEKHISYIEQVIESELYQKIRYRKYFLYASAGLVALFLVLLILLYGYLILYKEYIPSDKVLIGVSVTVFLSIIGLMNIVFKYLFSNTKDTTDYINNLRFKNNEKN